MRGYFENDFFGPRFGGRFGPFGCPIRGDFPGHHGPWGFGPFGHSFDHSPPRNGHDHHGPEHHKRGPPADGHRGPRCRRGSDSDSDGPEDRHCHRRPDFRGCDGRHHDFHSHGPGCHSSRHIFGRNPEGHCFGRRGPAEIPDRPWKGPWEGPWGADRHMHGFGHHGPHRPWFGHGRPCPYSSEERPSRKCDCKKRCDDQPCCSKNKENRGAGKEREENEASCDKDQDVDDTMFVLRVVLEKATRPQSI